MRGVAVRLSIVLPLLLGLSAPAAAQTATMPPNGDLLGTSCGEFLAVLAVANPGQNPSSDRQAAAQRAQHQSFLMMIWVNGYLTAKNGTPPAKAALTRDWLTNTTGAMVKVCKANPNQSIFEAAGKLP